MTFNPLPCGVCQRLCVAIVAGCLGVLPARAQQVPTAPEEDEIVVQATRSGRSADDEAIRVELIDRDEIEEKILMAPAISPCSSPEHPACGCR